MTLEACVALLLLLAGTRCGDARVRLNSIRTVILRESHVLPLNQSAWEPRVDLTLLQCMSDLECSEGSYCHAPSASPAHSRCRTCRRRKRRCHRDGMCCPGNRCSNSLCVADADGGASQRIQDVDADAKGWRRRGKAAPNPGAAGQACLRSSDCGASLCCARHFWTRICKPLLMEGQVCSRQRRKAQPGLELFQRCACGPGLACRAPPPPPPPPRRAPSLMDAAKSRSTAAGRHAPPPPPPPPRTRLHVCHRD